MEAVSFVVYMVNELCREWNTPPSAVFSRLEESGCIGQYLIPNYDVLHTLGTEYLIHDIETYLSVRGIAV